MKFNYKIVLLTAGLFLSTGMITANALKLIDIQSERDFYIAMFGGSSIGLGLAKRKPGVVEEELVIDPENPDTWPKDPVELEQNPTLRK